MTGAMDAGFVHYGAAILLTVVGLFIVIAYGNLIKKLIGLGIFQGAVFVHFILLAHVRGGAPPIVTAAADAGAAFANPLPHVLILTAIVVAIATASLAFALIIQVHHGWGETDEDLIAGQRR